MSRPENFDSQTRHAAIVGVVALLVVLAGVIMETGHDKMDHNCPETSQGALDHRCQVRDTGGSSPMSRYIVHLQQRSDREAPAR